jgi:class 3 adenylate cyclase/tetratricopeptide (TPR) repeat protein
MHHLVPHFILQNLAGGNLKGNFPAAALFLDISGFTNLTDVLLQHDQHGAEVLASVIKSILDQLVKCVYEQSGFITTFAGDAFLALFPLDPSAVPNSSPSEMQDACHRALATAWRMQQHMTAHNDYDTPYGTFTVSVKIGIASGHVNWGILLSQDESRATYYFQGTAVDGCAAAEHLAQQGQIVLSEDVFNLLAGSIAADPVADHYRLKQPTTPLTPLQAVNLPPATSDLMARFFPRDVVLQERRGEFRQVVSTFISLPSVRSEDQLAIFIQSVFELAEQYGGLLNRLDFGDKGANIFMLWGMPISYENDIERALSFVLALQSRTSIPIKAGLTYRIACAGFSGSPLREEYTAYGRGPNLAARFMMAAPRGEIWLDEGIAQKSKQKFDIEFEAKMAFKGFSEKQKVFVLLEQKETTGQAVYGPMLGRQRELVLLKRFIEPLVDGRSPGVLVMWGEAGIGKSRLIAALLQALNENEALPSQAIICQSDQILRQSLNPFRYWLRHYFGYSSASSEARNKRAFNRRIDKLIAGKSQPALVQELDRTRSCLGALVDLHWPDSLYAQLDPQGRFENTLIGLTTLLRAESLRKPLLIILEDAHWLDDDSRRYLQRLALTMGAVDNEYPIAIIVTARPEQSGPILDEFITHQELDLGLLSDDELSELAAEIFRGPVATGLQKLLVERTEGNPFFVEQIARYLQEQELVTLTENGWEVDAEHVKLMPTDVRAVLVARLDRLAKEVKRGVERAAVLGREFDVRLLAMMLSEDSGLTRVLEGGQKAVIWSALSQLRYLFQHALLRDAAYRMQLRARRQDLHRIAAEALANLFEDDLSPYYGQLAYHAEQAGRADLARDYYQQAGDVASQSYQNSQAADYYSRALALTPDSDLTGRYSILLSREAVYDLQGARQNQAKDLSALAVLAGHLRDISQQAEVSLRQSEYALITSNYDAAIAAAREAISKAKEADDVIREADGHRQWGRALRMQGAYAAARVQLELSAARALEAGADLVRAHSVKELGLVAVFQGDFPEALVHLEQALGIYQRIGDRRGESLSLQNLGTAAKDMADYATAQDYTDQALIICRQIGDRRGESFCFGNLAAVARREYYFVQAQEHYERALANYREIGDRQGEAICLNNLGIVACDLGSYEAARPHLKEALNLSQAIGDREGEGVCLNNLGIMAHDLGHLRQSRDFLLQGLAICRKIGFRTTEGTILNELGLVDLDLGNFAKAIARFEQALALRLELGQGHYVVEDQAGLALASLATGEQSEAQFYIEQVLAYLEVDPDLSGAERPLQVYLVCYQVLRAGQDDRATLILERAYQLLQQRATKIADEDLQASLLCNVPAHREIVLQYEANRTPL